MTRYALSDAQWSKIEGLLPGREDTVGGQLKIIGYSLKLSYIAIDQVFLGETCLKDLVIRKTFTDVIPDGQKLEFGNGFSGK